MPAKLLKMGLVSIKMLRNETWKPEITTYQKKMELKKRKDGGRPSTTDSSSKKRAPSYMLHKA